MELLVTHPVKKSDLGFHGNLFGGKLLAWFICNIVVYCKYDTLSRKVGKSKWADSY
jgi:hypothetical protein